MSRVNFVCFLVCSVRPLAFVRYLFLFLFLFCHFNLSLQIHSIFLSYFTLTRSCFSRSESPTLSLSITSHRLIRHVSPLAHSFPLDSRSLAFALGSSKPAPPVALSTPELAFLFSTFLCFFICLLFEGVCVCPSFAQANLNSKPFRPCFLLHPPPLTHASPLPLPSFPTHFFISSFLHFFMSSSPVVVLFHVLSALLYTLVCPELAVTIIFGTFQFRIPNPARHSRTHSRLVLSPRCTLTL